MKWLADADRSNRCESEEEDARADTEAVKRKENVSSIPPVS